MANIKSQKKRNRQNTVRGASNKAVKSELKTRVKTTAATAAQGADASELYRITQKRVDMAVSKGLLHPNTAARRKSRLAKRIASTTSSGPPPAPPLPPPSADRPGEVVRSRKAASRRGMAKPA